MNRFDLARQQSFNTLPEAAMKDALAVIHATWNPTNKSSLITLINGDLTMENKYPPSHKSTWHNSNQLEVTARLSKILIGSYHHNPDGSNLTVVGSPIISEDRYILPFYKKLKQ